MNDHLFSTVINKMGLTDMAAFCQINGRFSDYRKDVWFFGLLTRTGQEGPARELQKCTELLEIRRQRTEAGYLCLSRLENRMSPDQVAFYRDVRRKFDENPHELALSFRFEDSTCLLYTSQPFFFKMLFYDLIPGRHEEYHVETDQRKQRGRNPIFQAQHPLIGADKDQLWIFFRKVKFLDPS